MNPEKARDNTVENSPTPEGDRARERIEKSLEKAVEKEENSEHKIEQARREIEKQAKDMERPEVDIRNESEPTQYKTRSIQEDQYRQTLNEVQQKLPKSQRMFSKVIHAKYVERVSEVAEKTIMRPNIVLGATIGGFIGLLLFYVIAKRYGYELSGFEYFAFVIIGAVLAGIFEVVRNFIKKVRLRD